jgi:hypothetical protein
MILASLHCRLIIAHALILVDSRRVSGLVELADVTAAS